MITKRERYREILAVLTRHGIGVVDDEFFKHEAGDRARAEHPSPRVRGTWDHVHQTGSGAFDAH